DVRMALLDLKTRHLIEHVKNRGYRVINLTDREREDLIETRTVLEKAAVQLAAKRRTPQDIAELKAMVAQFDAAIETGDLDVLRG
ncbi:FCD domain-containing protein, partial [Lacticaseibacillus rhamnosus]